MKRFWEGLIFLSSTVTIAPLGSEEPPSKSSSGKCSAKKGKNGKPLEITLEDLAERYFRDSRYHERDIQDYLVALKGSPPMTVRTHISSVKVFLQENDVELPERFWRRLRGEIKGSKALTLDTVPSKEKLRKTVMHLPIHGRAMYLVLASSGMRIGESLQLKLEDVEFDTDPVKVNIRGMNKDRQHPGGIHEQGIQGDGAGMA